MKLFSKILCAGLLCLPVFAHAMHSKIKNDTSYSIGYWFDRGPLYPAIKGNSSFELTEEVFKAACGYTPSRCVLHTVVVNEAKKGDGDAIPNGTKIADIIYDYHDGVINVDRNTDLNIKVVPYEYDLTFEMMDK